MGKLAAQLVIACGQRIETIVESGDCLSRGVALRVVLRYFRGDRGVARCDGAPANLVVLDQPDEVEALRYHGRPAHVISREAA